MLSVDDQQLVQRDREIPGLATLLDPALYVELLAPVLLDGTKIDRIECTYLRYKPGVNCLATYVVHRKAGKELYYAKALTRQEAQRQGSRSEHVDAKRIVSTGVYSSDRRLPALRQGEKQDWQRQLLVRACPNRTDLLASDWSILRYKPERRLTAALTIGEKPGAVIKLFERCEYERARRRAKSFLVEDSIPLLPAVIGHSTRHAAIIWQWLAGEPLDQLIQQGSGALSAIATTGITLGTFHRQIRGKLGTTENRDTTTQLSASTEALAWLCPELREPLQKCMSAICERLTSTSYRPATIHGDFSSDQVISLPRGDIAFIDLDNSSLGDPACDLGGFMAFVERDVCRGRVQPSYRDSIQSALRSGYRSSGSDYNEDRIAVHTAAALIRLSVEPFRHRMIDWRALAGKIVARASELLERPSSKSTTVNRTDHANVVDPFGICDDPNLPWASASLNPDEVQQTFEQVRCWPKDVTNCVQVETIQVIRHKQGRRCLVRYRLRANGETKPIVALIGKMRSKRLDTQSFQLQQSLWKSRFHEGSDDAIQVPQPLGLIPAWNMWLQAEVPGKPSGTALTTNDTTLVSQRIAKAIEKLHASNMVVRRTHSMYDELRILHDRLPRVLTSYPRWEHRINRLLSACDKLSSLVKPHRNCLIHRDFYPDQILVDNQRLYLLDFDLACMGDPALDVGNFVGHLIEQSLRQPHTASALLDSQNAIVDAYCSMAGTNLTQSIDAYATLTLVRHIFISTLFTERTASTSLLLNHCEQRLALGGRR